MPCAEDAEQIRKIEKALEFWSQNTCLRFKKETDPMNIDYIYFDTGTTTTCTTPLGRQGGRQTLLLNGPCFNVRTISQLIGRALGVIYEVQRKDRDLYMVIEASKIDPLLMVNIDEVDSDYFNLPYEYGSVMQYYENEFKLGSSLPPVFSAKNSRFQTTIGSSYEPTFFDLTAINRYYCNNTCFGQNSQCSNSGYAKPFDCGTCFCPTGYAGRKCLEAQRSEMVDNCPNDVGAYEINERTPPLVISTPGWPIADPYKLAKCYWVFNALCTNNSRGRLQVEVNTTAFGLLKFDAGGQCLHWLEIKYKIDQGSTGLRLCGIVPREVAVTSQRDRMAIIFDADRDSSVTEAPSVPLGKGFRIKVSLGKHHQKLNNVGVNTIWKMAIYFLRVRLN
ncbi:zinc metalloproteinase nas-36-like [Gordionus sp. m RMFG-2023]|uniref:zinc metalloproteinase nas-36-like n=1 Tax=Gordionus sp. m RMFG-2023 TaxID=3053472 RepID=UPI0031FDBF8D